MARFVLRSLPGLAVAFVGVQVLKILFLHDAVGSGLPWPLELMSGVTGVIVLGVLASTLLYLYTVLAGGVMSREE